MAEITAAFQASVVLCGYQLIDVVASVARDGRGARTDHVQQSAVQQKEPIDGSEDLPLDH